MNPAVKRKLKELLSKANRASKLRSATYLLVQEGALEGEAIDKAMDLVENLQQEVWDSPVYKAAVTEVEEEVYRVP